MTTWQKIGNQEFELDESGYTGRARATGGATPKQRRQTTPTAQPTWRSRPPFEIEVDEFGDPTGWQRLIGDESGEEWNVRTDEKRTREEKDGKS